LHNIKEYIIRPTEYSDKDWVANFTSDHWGSESVVAHGIVYHPHKLSGFVAIDSNGQTVGLVTYIIKKNECEIITLNSIQQRIGIGTSLVDRVKAVAKDQDCSRLWLITTNDNLHALEFYQKRGFELVAVHKGVIQNSRRLKPEIELEYQLTD